MRTLVLLLLLPPASLAAQDRLTGTWQGYWARAGDTMAVAMHVRRDSAGTYAATFDADRLRVSGIPFNEVQAEGGAITLVLRGDRTTMTFRGLLRGDSLTGRFVEENTTGEFAYARATSTPALVERAITFGNGSVTLSGSLLVPGGGGPWPAVVFLHGSGAEGRWASQFLASRLVANGIAAFVWDKRGVGQSRGDWRQASPDDLIADAVAAVERLRREPGIDPRRVGVHGHSQGGTLAPAVAVQSQAAFVIASAAAGQPLDSVERYSILSSILPRATSARDSLDAQRYVAELVAAAYRGEPRARLDSLAAALRERPWFFAPPPPEHHYWTFSRQFGAFDPLAWWARVRVPVLLIGGDADARVPIRESFARIAAVMRHSVPAVSVTVRILERADHTFRLAPGPGGWPVTAPEYLPSLLEWLRDR